MIIISRYILYNYWRVIIIISSPSCVDLPEVDFCIATVKLLIECGSYHHHHPIADNHSHCSGDSLCEVKHHPSELVEITNIAAYVVIIINILILNIIIMIITIIIESYRISN